MAVQYDPGGKTFIYRLRVVDVQPAQDRGDLVGRRAFCQWLVQGEKDCSQPFLLGSKLQDDYCAFLVVSFVDLADRSVYMQMTLGETGKTEPLGIVFMDLAQITAAGEEPVEASAELRSGSHVVAIVHLVTDASQRWEHKAVVPRPEGFFVHPASDPQAASLAGVSMSSAANCHHRAGDRSESGTSQLLASFVPGDNAGQATRTPPRAEATPSTVISTPLRVPAAGSRSSPGASGASPGAAQRGGSGDRAAASTSLSGCSLDRLCTGGLLTCRWGGGQQDDIVEAPPPRPGSDDAEEFLSSDLELHWKRHGDTATLQEMAPPLDGPKGDVAL